MRKWTLRKNRRKRRLSRLPELQNRRDYAGALSRNRCRVGKENVGKRVSGAGSDASEYRYAARRVLSRVFSTKVVLSFSFITNKTVDRVNQLSNLLFWGVSIGVFYNICFYNICFYFTFWIVVWIGISDSCNGNLCRTACNNSDLYDRIASVRWYFED